MINHNLAGGIFEADIVQRDCCNQQIGGSIGATYFGSFPYEFIMPEVGFTVPAGPVCEEFCEMPTRNRAIADDGPGVGQLKTTWAWNMTLLADKPLDFKGRVISESSNLEGKDTCWFPGSEYPPYTRVTGSSWTVGEKNEWGPDRIGWYLDVVQSYRNLGRVPCEYMVWQTIKIDCPNGTHVGFETNVHRSKIFKLNLGMWVKRNDEMKHINN